MSSVASPSSVGDLFDQTDMPDLFASDDPQAILVNSMIETTELEPDILYWLLFAPRYCKEDNYGRRFAQEYIRLAAMSSTRRFKWLVDMLEALSLKRFLEKMKGNLGGPGMGGK